MRPHSWGMYIVCVGDLTCCVTTICVLMSSPPGYRGGGTSRAMGERERAQVLSHRSRERDGVTSGDNVIRALNAHHRHLSEKSLAGQH